MSRTIRRQTLDGVRWTMINAIGEKVLSFGTTMVLARILDPSHFGLFALAFIAIDSLGILKNLGLDTAIVQRTDRVEEAANTAFFIQPILGAVFYIGLALLAPCVGKLLGHPEVEAPLRALGLIFVVMSFGNVPAALIQKSMRFGIRTVANLTGMVVYAVSAVILAKQGHGVYSLIIAYLIRWVICIAIQWIVLRWTPSRQFDWALFKEMLHFSKYVVGAWTIGFLGLNMDRFVIGRWLGITQLGYYTLCMGLANMVTSQVSTRAYQVVFPTFSNIQESQVLMRAGFIKLVKYLFLCSIPVAILLMMSPSDFLHAFYGPRWVQAAPILQILAIFGVLETMRIGIDPALLGAGRVKLVFALNTLHLIIMGAGGAWMAMHGSIKGVAWWVALSSGIPGTIALAAMMRYLRISFAELCRALVPSLGSAIFLAGVVGLAHYLRIPLLGSRAPSGIWLISMLAAGIVAYVVSVLMLDRPIARDVFNLAGMQPPKFLREAAL